MTFRDDHDAALARADALEDEVERERARADAAAKVGATLRRERDELAARIEQLEASKAVEAPKSQPPETLASAVRDLILVIVMGIVFLVVIALAAGAR